MIIQNTKKYGSFLKAILHSRMGSFIGFHLGIRGYNRVDAVIKRSTGQIERLWPSYNARVNKGAALTASLLSGSSLGSISSPLPPKYIALSTSVLTPVATDTTLTGETVVSGLARAAATAGGYSAPSVLDGGATFTQSYTFTNTPGGAITINSTALFDASSSGNMFAEANLSAPVSIPNAGDQVSIVWTVNV